MDTSDRIWHALEIVDTDQTTTPSYAEPPHRAIASVVYEALWSYDCGPITFLSLPGITRQRTLLRAGSAPRTDTPLPEVPTITADAVTNADKLLAKLAVKRVSEHVGLSIVEVDTTPVGTASATTYRLVVPSNLSVNTPSTSPPALRKVFETVRSTPHALSVVAERGDDGKTEVSIRLVDFTPKAQLETRDELAASRTDPSAAATILPEIFGKTTLTNYGLPEQYDWDIRSEPYRLTDQPVFRKELAAHRNDTQAELAMTLARSHKEYTEVFRRTPTDPLAARYTSLGLRSRLTVDSERLPAFFPVGTQMYAQSVWRRLPGRTTVRINPLVAVQVPETMTTRKTDPTANGKRQTTLPSASSDVSTFESTVSRWCLQRGDQLEALDLEIDNVPFVRVRPDGSRLLVYVIPTDEFVPGELVAASRHALQTADYDGLSVFAARDSQAEKAFETVVYPFRRTTFAETELYRQPRSIHSNNRIAVRPTDTPPERWVITHGTNLECRIDGTTVATCEYTAPVESLIEQLPRAITDGRRYVVRYPTDRDSTGFSTPEEFHAAFTPIFHPARPGSVASLLDSTTVFRQVGSNSNFSETRISASWDDRRLLEREPAGKQKFMAAYTTYDRNSTIPFSSFVFELATYLRYQTDEPLSASLEFAFEDRDQSGVKSNYAWRYNPD